MLGIPFLFSVRQWKAPGRETHSPPDTKQVYGELMDCRYRQITAYSSGGSSKRYLHGIPNLSLIDTQFIYIPR